MNYTRSDYSSIRNNCYYIIVTNKPKKDNNRMKIIRTKDKDRKRELVEMTANHTSRPEKVLFLPTRIFCFANALLPYGTIREANTHCTHLQFARANTQIKNCKRVQSYPCKKHCIWLMCTTKKPEVLICLWLKVKTQSLRLLPL